MYIAYCKFSTCRCDPFNYTASKLVTCTACMCLNRSFTQYVDSILGRALHFSCACTPSAYPFLVLP